MKKELKNTELWKFFKEYWLILQDYFEPEKDSRYWDNLVGHASKMTEKYANTDFGRFASDLVQALLNYLERKSTGKNQKYDIFEIDAERKNHERYVIKEYLRKHKGKTVEEVLNGL